MNQTERLNDVRTPDAAPADDEYLPPEVVVHDGDDFVRELGPAQACSPGV
jgi:hypothetical protein